MKKQTLLTLNTAIFASLLSLSAFATSGPDHRSFRALAMGNAFVAVVDDKDAMYYNTAGLNLINSLGNPSSRPDLAAYPRDRFDLQWDVVGLSGPWGKGWDTYHFYNKHQNSFSDFDSLRNDQTLFSDLTPFDRNPLGVGVQDGLVFAMHNFGVATWADAEVSPYVDKGILIPQAGVQNLQVDGVFQIAGARGLLDNKLSVGVGYRLANRQQISNYQISASDISQPDTVIQAIKDTLNNKLDGAKNFGDYGNALDLGVLWQQTNEVRFGASLENLGMYLNHKPVTPKFTVGTAYTPLILQSGGRLSRKVNLALDFEDLFNNDNNYKPLSKIDMGIEVEQNLWWLMSVRLGGGFKGGYWTAGAGLGLFSAVRIEAVSWADEGGYYTGQIENRVFAVNVAIGN